MTSKNKHAKHTPPADATEAGSQTGEASANEAPIESVDSISVEELHELKAKAAKADENWDKYLRTAAELDNYRKRVAREKEELARFTTERIVTALLPALDNLERAIDAAQKHGAEGATMLEGITQVYNQFRRSLAEFGLQEMIANVGDPFDANKGTSTWSRIEEKIDNNSGTYRTWKTKDGTRFAKLFARPDHRMQLNVIWLDVAPPPKGF